MKQKVGITTMMIGWIKEVAISFRKKINACKTKGALSKQAHYSSEKTKQSIKENIFIK